MKILTTTLFAMFLVLTGCKNEPTLQKFFVENSENKNFIALDVSSNIINTDKAKLSKEQQEAIEAFEKMNIIAFKNDGKNIKEYETEKQKLTTILKDDKYQELIKVGSGNNGASISFVGQEDKVEEFIIYANKKENGFAVIRVLGNEMNPNDVLNMLSILQSSNLNLEQLKPLEALMK